MTNDAKDSFNEESNDPKAVKAINYENIEAFTNYINNALGNSTEQASERLRMELATMLMQYRLDGIPFTNNALNLFLHRAREIAEESPSAMRELSFMQDVMNEAFLLYSREIAAKDLQPGGGASMGIDGNNMYILGSKITNLLESLDPEGDIFSRDFFNSLKGNLSVLIKRCNSKEAITRDEFTFYVRKIVDTVTQENSGFGGWLNDSETTMLRQKEVNRLAIALLSSFDELATDLDIGNKKAPQISSEANEDSEFQLAA